MQSQVINIDDFMQRLKDEGLVIVRAEDIAEESHQSLEDFRRRVMRRKSISFSDLIKTKLLKVTTRQGLYEWVLRNLNADEWYSEAKGKKQRMIMTSAIKSRGYYG